MYLHDNVAFCELFYLTVRSWDVVKLTLRASQAIRIKSQTRSRVVGFMNPMAIYVVEPMVASRLHCKT